MPTATAMATACVEFDDEAQVGAVPGVAGAHTQAASLLELTQNLKEVLETWMPCTPLRRGMGPCHATRNTSVANFRALMPPH